MIAMTVPSTLPETQIYVFVAERIKSDTSEFLFSRSYAREVYRSPEVRLAKRASTESRN